MTVTAVVVGQGYVGLPLAIRACEAGIRTLGFDLNSGLVDSLNAGRAHIDDIADEQVEQALARGFRATSDPADINQADVVVVCVPTPLADEGGPDLSAVEAAGRMIGERARSGAVVILESTTYPGTTEEVFAPLVLDGGRLTLDEDVWIAFSPERVDPGNASYGIQNTPKVVGGVSPASTDRAVAFYETFIDTVIRAKGAKEAEMAKLLENTFRHVNIALVNEMVRFCRELDIDLWDAIDAASTKPFGFMAFRPGPGVGGHCIPVDPSYLSHRVKAKLGYAFRMVELAEEVNLAAPTYVADRAVQMLNDQRKAANGANVLLVGVTYKPNIADMRETPAAPLAAALERWGSNVTYFDPYVPDWDPFGSGAYAHAEDLEAAASEADLVVLLQPHDQIDLVQLTKAAPLLLDTRGLVAGPNVTRL